MKKTDLEITIKVKSIDYVTLCEKLLPIVLGDGENRRKVRGIAAFAIKTIIPHLPPDSINAFIATCINNYSDEFMVYINKSLASYGVVVDKISENGTMPETYVCEEVFVNAK